MLVRYLAQTRLRCEHRVHRPRPPIVLRNVRLMWAASAKPTACATAMSGPPAPRAHDVRACVSGHLFGLGTCWSIRIGLPSGSVRMRYAGPVVDSSAAGAGVRPRALMVF